jgi:hypothetical protein
MTHFDSLQVGSAATSVTAATLGHMAPHPLQYAVWILAIVSAVYSIYRGWAADRKADKQTDNA